jgi:hypothetical protein
VLDIGHDSIAAAIGSKDWRVRATLRAIFRRSLYVLIKFATCYNEPRNLMDAETFKESCDWLQWVVTTKKRGLFEDPRAHIKSTRVARGIPEWFAVQVPDEKMDLPEEYDRAMRMLDEKRHMRGPDSRIVLGSDSKERAAAFVGSSKTDWETNPVLRYLYPELLWPSGRAPYKKWRDTAYTLNNRRNPALPDPYLVAVGLDSKAQGGRAEGIIIDDLVGETSYKSPTELMRRQDWVRTIGFLLENRDFEHQDGGFVLVDGNRWALDDVNSMIHNEFKDWAIWHRAGFRCMIHLAGNCGRWADNEERECAITDETLWKARYPDAASLENVTGETGPEIFSAQILNDPTVASELDYRKYRPFRLGPATLHREGKPPLRSWCVIIPRVDDGVTTEKSNEVIPLSALSSHIISIDPADSKNPKNARTCVSWFAMDKPTGRVFWLDCRAGHWQAEQAVNEAFALFEDANDKTNLRPRILIEKVACQGYFGAALKFKAQQDKRRRFLPEPEMIPPAHGLGKDDRIRRRVGHRLNQGLLYLRAGLQLPKWEVRHFPTGTKDSLDTLAQAEEVYLEQSGAARSDRLARARRRKRKRRIAAADSTGVPL